MNEIETKRAESMPVLDPNKFYMLDIMVKDGEVFCKPYEVPPRMVWNEKERDEYMIQQNRNERAREILTQIQKETFNV